MIIYDGGPAEYYQGDLAGFAAWTEEIRQQRAAGRLEIGRRQKWGWLKRILYVRP
jgi:hypothetical protein